MTSPFASFSYLLLLKLYEAAEGPDTITDVIFRDEEALAANNLRPHGADYRKCLLQIAPDYAEKLLNKLSSVIETAPKLLWKKMCRFV